MRTGGGPSYSLGSCLTSGEDQGQNVGGTWHGARMTRLALKLTSQQVGDMHDRVFWTVRDHLLGPPTGGTAVGSKFTCSCGVSGTTNGTRDMAQSLGFQHVTQELMKALSMSPREWDRRHHQRLMRA